MEIRRCQTPSPPLPEEEQQQHSYFLPTAEHQLTPYASPVITRKPVLELNNNSSNNNNNNNTVKIMDSRNSSPRAGAAAAETTPTYYYLSPTNQRERLNSWGDGDLTPTPRFGRPTLQIVSPSAAATAAILLPQIPALDSTTTASSESTRTYSSKRKRAYSSSPSFSSSPATTKRNTSCRKTSTPAMLQASLADLFMEASSAHRNNNLRGLPRLPDLSGGAGGGYPNKIEDEQQRLSPRPSGFFMDHQSHNAAHAASENCEDDDDDMEEARLLEFKAFLDRS